MLGLRRLGALRFAGALRKAKSLCGKTCGKWVGSFDDRLGVVGERSSGEEASMRVGVERGEVRIPE